MKILFLGAFGKGALENFYVDGFGQFPVSLEKFDITEKYYQKISSSLVNRVVNKLKPDYFFREINEALLSYVRNRHYDVVLVFKGLTLLPDTLLQLKKHTTLLCCYNPDHPFRFYSAGSGNRNILESISVYDLYINYARSVSAEMAKRYPVKVATIPFGYDSRPFQKIKADWLTALSEKIIFVGSFDLERARFLKSIDEENLLIFGDQKWRTRTSAFRSLRMAFAGRGLYDDEYKLANQSAFASLNILRKQNLEEQSHNMRSFEVPGYGGLLLSNRTEEQEYFFEDMKEAVFFDDALELQEKLAFLKRNNHKVAQIKAAALSRSERSGYSYLNRSREMYELFRDNIKS